MGPAGEVGMTFFCGIADSEDFPARSVSGDARMKKVAVLLVWFPEYCESCVVFLFRQKSVIRAVLVIAAGCCAVAARADELHRVRFLDANGRTRVVEGRIRVTAQDGGILLEGREGRLWNVTPEKLQEKAATGEKFTPWPGDELAKRLLEEFGAGFSIVRTEHFVICSSAGEEYARWCGSIFERLLGAFRRQWRRKETDLRPPEFPLQAIIFSDRQEYARYAAEDAGAATAASAKGYYSIGTNRMVLYDLTAELKGSRPRTAAEYNQRLGTQAFNVATIIHEATHQIAFNTGLHTRYADNPLWLTEGMAMYFETPDLKSRSGWRTIGKVNPVRYRRFREYLARRRGSDSLLTLIRSDERFTSEETAADAYAESWALSFYLIRTKRQAYLDYLERISAKKSLFWDDPAQRVAEFKAAFGEDLEELDRGFVRYMKRFRVR